VYLQTGMNAPPLAGRRFTAGLQHHCCKCLGTVRPGASGPPLAAVYGVQPALTASAGRPLEKKVSTRPPARPIGAGAGQA